MLRRWSGIVALSAFPHAARLVASTPVLQQQNRNGNGNGRGMEHQTRTGAAVPRFEAFAPGFDLNKIGAQKEDGSKLRVSFLAGTDQVVIAHHVQTRDFTETPNDGT